MIRNLVKFTVLPFMIGLLSLGNILEKKREFTKTEDFSQYSTKGLDLFYTAPLPEDTLQDVIPSYFPLALTGVTPGEHTIFGRRISGDCSISEVEFGIIDYPRFFTPNQDGFHDTWNIIGIGVEPNLNAQIYIFDRFGKLLKQLSPTSEGWDGTFNGQPMISDDYWFRVNYTEPDGLGTQREFVGHFTLKR